MNIEVEKVSLKKKKEKVSFWAKRKVESVLMWATDTEIVPVLGSCLAPDMNKN